MKRAAVSLLAVAVILVTSAGVVFKADSVKTASRGMTANIGTDTVTIASRGMTA
ncbi:hypothetical protein G3M81_12175 [Bacillus paralicheniformis]|uniref:hypothetical protein n=1 Tax=Bacillus paralicheniformis TaxID=1648923 RepID=UPI0013EF5AB9|nr:hypothetical protein [Bacillus paralicheniformis]MEC0756427.1 hypothetical protein [Bacillus haynesii]QII49449.1 hypothetical protein G3M81_12175 [Bacillus paralicheniformis]